MRTLTVIAKFPQDGLYYLGKITKEGDPVTISFPYNNGLRGSEVEEQIPRSDVVTYAGAAPWPKLELGDHVLTKVACDGMAHISYFPGKITEVPNAKFKNAYNVKLYTGTTVRKKRRDIIRVNGGQFQRLTEELSQKHHHKPDLPKPPPPIPVQEPVNLNPSKGDEVLARWQDDGWYYFGIVINMPRLGTKGVNRQYGVMDSTSHIEKIEEKYIFADRMRDHLMKGIQESSYVIAEHPDFPHSFAPGKVLMISKPHTATIEFYDGETKVINLPYIYLCTKLRYTEDIKYIRRRSKREKVRVIARDNNTGIYHKGSIVAEIEKHSVTIKFDTLGEEIVQSIHHVLTNTLLITPANNRQVKHFHYVLAPMEKNPYSYLPAKVEAFEAKEELKLKLCNKSRSVCEPSKCYYISPDYYFNAFQYFHNRKAKQQVEQGRREHNNSRNKPVVQKVRAQSEDRRRINRTTKQNSPTISEAVLTARGSQTTSSLNGKRRGSSRSRQFSPQSDLLQLQQQEISTYREGRPISDQILSPTSKQILRENLEAGTNSRTENIRELNSSQIRPKTPKSTPRRWASPDSRARNRDSIRRSRNTMALKDHVTYTTTVVKMKADDNP